MTSLLQRDGGGRFALSGAVNQVVICNEFACAMQIYGRQLQVPDVTHFQIAFTQIAVQDHREMPFVTWGKTGYMFTMYVDSRGLQHKQQKPQTKYQRCAGLTQRLPTTQAAYLCCVSS